MVKRNIRKTGNVFFEINRADSGPLSGSVPCGWREKKPFLLKTEISFVHLLTSYILKQPSGPEKLLTKGVQPSCPETR